MVVNTENKGAVNCLPEDCCAEVSCVISAKGASPVAYGEMPEAVRGLLQMMKAMEQCTIQAALTGDYGSLLQAFALNPLIPDGAEQEGCLMNFWWLTKNICHSFAEIIAKRKEEGIFCEDSVVSKFSESRTLRKAHHALARKAAAQSAVLLEKTGENILPLKPGTHVALVGDFAFEPRYQGAGSSMVNVTKLDKMTELIGEYDLVVTGTARGYKEPVSGIRFWKKKRWIWPRMQMWYSTALALDELSESEGIDRTHMRIPQNQIALLEAVSRVNENVVGILSAGAAVEMPWHHCLKGLLHAICTDRQEPALCWIYYRKDQSIRQAQ